MENKTFDQLWEDFRIENPNTVGTLQEQYESFKWLYDRLKGTEASSLRMEKNNMTAVEYVIEQLRKLAHNPKTHLGMGDIRVTQGYLDDLEQIGKEMEKEQIINAFVNGISEGYDDYICTEKGISRDRKTGKEYFAGMYKNDVRNAARMCLARSQ